MLKKNKLKNKKKAEEEDIKDDIQNDLIDSDTSLSSILNDDMDYQVRMRETNTKYNLRKRPFFTLRLFEGSHEPNDYGDKLQYKRRKLKD